jgi:hypothetical protein
LRRADGADDFVMRTAVKPLIVAGLAALGVVGLAPGAIAQTQPTVLAGDPDGRCPSAVSGAKTVVKDTENGAEVTITGNATAAKEIQRRAKEIASIRLVQPPAENDCVVAYYPGSQAELETTPHGIKVIISASNVTSASELQEQIRARVNGLAGPKPTAGPTP